MSVLSGIKSSGSGKDRCRKDRQKWEETEQLAVGIETEGRKQ